MRLLMNHTKRFRELEVYVNSDALAHKLFPFHGPWPSLEFFRAKINKRWGDDGGGGNDESSEVSRFAIWQEPISAPLRHFTLVSHSKCDLDNVPTQHLQDITIHLSNNNTQDVASFVQCCPAARELSLTCPSAGAAAAQGAPFELPSLETLEIEDDLPTSFSSVIKCVNLRDLTVRYGDSGNGYWGPAPITMDLPHLTSLHLQQTIFHPQAVRQFLRAIPTSLRFLYIRYCNDAYTVVDALLSIQGDDPAPRCDDVPETIVPALEHLAILQCQLDEPEDGAFYDTMLELMKRRPGLHVEMEPAFGWDGVYEIAELLQQEMPGRVTAVE